MSYRTFTYSMKEGIKNIWRNRMYSLASIGTITASLFLFGILFFLVVNFQSVVKSAETSVGITIFFDEGISQAKIDAIGDELARREEVKSIEFVSGEETWQKYKEEYLSEELVESFGDDNPLEDSDSYTIYLHDVASQSSLVEFAENLEGVRKVNYSESIANTFSNVNSIIAIISVAIIVILISVSIFLINSSVTMGVAARKEEISIMKLLGATSGFISGPFVIEGILIGIIGSVIPLFILYLVYGNLLNYISSKYTSIFNVLTFVNSEDIFRILLPIILIIGIGIGFFGSFITVRRQIRQVEVS
ncbi:MAG: FtsX-like permease family protein [Clostridiales bacterium]|nr:FtsX-like permease family protein [Clostridiales bacterium]